VIIAPTCTCRTTAKYSCVVATDRSANAASKPPAAIMAMAGKTSTGRHRRWGATRGTGTGPKLAGAAMSRTGAEGWVILLPPAID